MELCLKYNKRHLEVEILLGQNYCHWKFIDPVMLIKKLIFIFIYNVDIIKSKLLKLSLPCKKFS